MSGREQAAAVTGLALGVPVLAAVVGLLHRTLLPIREIERYVADIRSTNERIIRNLDARDELGHTRDTAVAIPARATTWLEASSR
jgi:hypothetical protein